MAFPKPVPSLSEDEFAHFRERMDEFEVPDEMEEDLNKHRKALKANEN